MSDSGLITRSPALVTFGVMVVAIVGGGVLALPTALAPFGVRQAIVILVVMGLVNLVSLLAMCSAISRSTAAASGRGRLSTLATEQLGPTTALIATTASIVLWFGLLVVYILGLAKSLGDIGGSPAAWAIAVLAAIGAIVFLQARRLFVASATAVAILNLAILFALIVGVALNARSDLFTAGPLPTGAGGTSDTLQLVFGTVLFAYFGHTSLFSVAPEVARVDPSGRALRRGASAAMLAAIVINVGWVAACLSAIPGEQFRAEASTGLSLITEVGGPWMKPLSVAFVLLAMGGAGLNAAFSLGDVISERLPKLRKVSTVLRPGSSVEAFEPLLAAGITLAAVVENDETVLIARGRRGRQHQREVIQSASWDGAEMLHSLGISRRRAVLRVTIDGTIGDGLIINVESTLPLAEREPASPRAALLGTATLPGQDHLEHLTALIVQSVVRQPAPASEVIAAVALRSGATEQLVLEAFTILDQQGRLRVRDDGLVHPVLGQRSRTRSAVVEALLTGIEDQSPPGQDAVSARRAAALSDGVWRRGAQTLPAAAALLVVLALLAAGASFAAAIDLVAMATILLLAGTVPLLLGMSLRQRAERSVSAARLADARPIQAALLIGFTCVAIVYATVIYDAWYQRLTALVAFAATVTMVISSVRAGAFSKRSTLLVELDQRGNTSVSALDHGTTLANTPVVVHDEATNTLSVEVPPGLHPPLLLLALDGEAVPARLGPWMLTVDGRDITRGQLEDSAGEAIDWPADLNGHLRCTWKLR